MRAQSITVTRPQAWGPPPPVGAIWRPDAPRTGIKALGPSLVDSDDGVVTLRLYDAIDSWGGWWGMSSAEFTATLDGLPRDTKEIRLHINSPGGDVFEGIAILNALRNHRAEVVTIVDGLAASIASVIALAGDQMLMSPNSEYMIHEGWGGVVGGAGDMRKMADVLDHLNDNIAGAYASRAGGDVASWRALMAEETWFSAEETVTAGLAGAIYDGPATGDGPAPAAVAASFDRSAFKYAGRDQAPAPIRTAPAAGLARAQAALIRAKRRIPA